MEGNMYQPSDAGMMAGMLVWLIMLGVYFFFAFMQFKIAQKLRHENAWFAFIPILNTVQMVQLAGKSLLWFFFMFIPIVNVICLAIVWIEIAKAVGKSPVVGFLSIIPPISFFTLPMMAFGDSQSAAPGPPSQTTTREPQHVG